MLLTPRYLPRLTATIGLFTRYGLADFAKQQGIQALAQPPEDDGALDGDTAKLAEGFRKRLVELGPAYVKLGQVLSTRPDLLPPAYIRELEKLQDDVPSVPFADIEHTVEEELGGRIGKLFSEFEHDPLGSASLGQVHAAWLRDGRPVVVKVQRPDIRQQLADDVEFFHELAAFLAAHTEAGARVDMVGVVQQLERALADELDYRVEARNAMTFRRSLADFPRILVPRVIEAYSTERVLTTERIRGVKIDAVSPLARLEHDFAPVADELTRAYLKQIVLDAHFHADPHPGNVFVVLPSTENPPTPTEARERDRRAVPREAATPLARMESQAQQRAAPQPPEIDAKLALIDFGMTARLPTSLREQIVRLMLDVADNRGDDAAETLIEIGQTLPGFDRAGYVREIASLMARNYDLTVGDVQIGSVLYELINISFQRGLRLPAELTLLAKAMFNLDAVTRALDATYNPIETIRDFGNQVMAERARRELSPRRLMQLASEGGNLVASLPHRLDLITQRLASNEFATRVEVPQVTQLTSALQKVANRIFSGVVLAGLLIASAMLLPYRRSLGTAGFVLAGALGLWMVLSILWSDRRDRR
ncbi:ABC-1 domain-containing protein [Gemmatirosa kalamazoonensis]|uniref:ABC-1 domain-containing protein n=1 Tax=Gemmatirosa kalamazoonensis TaxID=861299 RepID=W0RJN8_9BACT|nr:AarF/UbiB family protein [Gemmatirosa kalamazoonensis]AHG90555.1 ABC-1 domain-containing protein [Gemmatirosa kalamazoonensis]